MNSKVSTIKFGACVAFLLIGSYFLFEFDSKTYSKLAGENFASRVLKSIRMPNVRLGVDLQGGAHLVVGVEIEKAIENRLMGEGKVIERALKEKKLAKVKRKEVKKNVLELEFANVAEAGKAYQAIKSELGTYIKINRKKEIVLLSLAVEEEHRIRSQVVEQAINILKRRLDSSGAQGLTVQQHGARQIVVQLPGESDVEGKKELITQTAHLEFKIVEKQAPEKDILLDAYDGELPPDKMIIPGRGSEGRNEFYLVSAFADLTGDHIVHASMDFDQYGSPGVSFVLDSAGSREFAELTGQSVGKNLGIIIDNVAYSAPRVKEPITGGRCQITGHFTSEEAKALEIVLNSGALQAPLVFESENLVGASLGQDSITKGIFSCLIGLLLVFIFSIFYYRLAGIFAMLAILYNLFLIMLFLSWFKATLTLPGIAGIVLTIGMAIDASILIYEKIREELATGSTLRKSVKDGFSDALVVILDSNITTFLTGLILFKFGGPAIKGFAVTLMIGIIATLIAGIYFLRALFEFVLDTTKTKKLTF
jgi:preprotein translocase subunit SecD